MKEAAGEANLTVVAIILIAIIVAVATPLIRSLMQTSMLRSCCTNVGGIWKSNDCSYPNSDNFSAFVSADEEYTQCQRNAGATKVKTLQD